MGTPRAGEVFAGRRVLVTGHTGFKGSWLALWLLQMGAEVIGYALEPDTTPSLFSELGLSEDLSSHIGDVRDTQALASIVRACQPEIVFHLAAQPLVRRSYAEPVYTLAVNVMGTASILEAMRTCDSARVLINVTTDKVYENNETGVPFKESDRLGGHDVYSASKACSEIVTASYRDSFFSGPDSDIQLVTARAGNVIGGGDWAEDRIVPDLVRALTRGVPVEVRNPRAVRPWQHVLDPVAGYLRLASHLWDCNDPAARQVNFGPNPDDRYTVEDLVERAIARWGAGSWTSSGQADQPREAGVLRLDTRKAREVLGWMPVWGFEETIDRTIGWYRRRQDDPASVRETCLADIAAYQAMSGLI